MNPQAHLLAAGGAEPPLNASGKAEYARRQAALHHGDRNIDPISSCLLHGIPRLLYTPLPFLILQTTRDVNFIHEANHTFRNIYWDRPPGEEPDPTYLGSAVAHFVGRTLVIDSTGFNDLTWLDYSGLPHGAKLTVEERYTLQGPDTIQGDITLTDPDFYTAPWTTHVTFRRQPGMSLRENVCTTLTGCRDHLHRSVTQIDASVRPSGGTVVLPHQPAQQRGPVDGSEDGTAATSRSASAIACHAGQARPAGVPAAMSCKDRSAPRCTSSSMTSSLSSARPHQCRAQVLGVLRIDVGTMVQQELDGLERLLRRPFVGDALDPADATGHHQWRDVVIRRQGGVGPVLQQQLHQHQVPDCAARRNGVSRSSSTSH